MIVHLCVWLLRIFGSLLDGWNGRRIGWWPFHIFNWMRREVVIILLYFQLYGWPWIDIQLWMRLAALHTLGHYVFYRIGEEMKWRWKNRFKLKQ